MKSRTAKKAYEEAMIRAEESFERTRVPIRLALSEALDTAEKSYEKAIVPAR